MSEPFCTDCPDHEACSTGIPCSVTKQANNDPSALLRPLPDERN